MKTLEEGLIDFRNQYPSITSSDIQAFIIGWNAAIQSINSSNEPDELRAVGKHEQKEKVCPKCHSKVIINITSNMYKCKRCNTEWIILVN